MSAAQQGLVARLRRGLADTSAQSPRPLADLGLPAAARHLMDAATLAALTPAAVLVPVVAREQGATVVLTVRTEQLRNHAGQVSFPGGRRDRGDDGPVANALRESHEEIGLAPDAVEILGFLDDYPTVTGFRITPVVGLLQPPARLRPDAGEVAEVFEVPLAVVADLASYRRRWLRRAGLRIPYYVVAHGERTIWGATAAMLRDLARRVAAIQ